MRRLPHDVQRDATFHAVVVAFRNSVEQMMIREGRLEPDHLFWGFRFETRLGGWMPGDGDDDAGVTGSRVPRRPFGGSGVASVALGPPDESILRSVARPGPAPERTVPTISLGR
jgi:hypothetical protein